MYRRSLGTASVLFKRILTSFLGIVTVLFMRRQLGLCCAHTTFWHACEQKKTRLQLLHRSKVLPSGRVAALQLGFRHWGPMIETPLPYFLDSMFVVQILKFGFFPNRKIIKQKFVDIYIYTEIHPSALAAATAC